MLRHGDTLKIAPGANNPGELKSFHLIHPDLFIFRTFGLVETTFSAQEETAVRGNLRLSKIGAAGATWTVPRTTQRALAAFLDFIDFVDLDTPITIRTWNKFVFADYSGILQFVPPSDLESNSCDIVSPVFTYVALEGI